MCVIEAKASGTPLTHELRRMGIPVTSYTPSRGQDKVARMNSVAPIFESGMVWAPEDDFAEEVIEEMASFPFGDYDDYCDSATMALMRFRQGGFVSLYEDYQDEVKLLKEEQDSILLKIYITRFVWDGTEYIGPDSCRKFGTCKTNCRTHMD